MPNILCTTYSEALVLYLTLRDLVVLFQVSKEYVKYLDTEHEGSFKRYVYFILYGVQRRLTGRGNELFIYSSGGFLSKSSYSEGFEERINGIISLITNGMSPRDILLTLAELNFGSIHLSYRIKNGKRKCARHHGGVSLFMSL